MSNTLIIFIDSMPFALLEQTPFLNTVPHQWAIEPGFGYSVNVHAELFAGRLPDDVGYFGEWAYSPQHSPGWRIRHILPVLDALFRPYVLNRGLQHLLTRRYSRGHPMPNIRLRDLDKFALQGHHIQSAEFAEQFPTIFSQFPHLHTLLYRNIGRTKGERDQFLFEQGMAALDHHGSLFVPLPDLDGFGHQYGTEHPTYRQHLAAVDNWCAQLSAKFQTRYPDGHLFIVSDHGMVTVDKGVYLDIEEQLGAPNGRNYLYFSDANLLRVWVQNEQLRPRLAAYLENFGHGRLLTAAERTTYGLTSSHFGDFIYVLEERLAFEPSTFARHIPRGMHGYHPTSPNQLAIGLYAGPNLPAAIPSRMKDLYHLFQHSLATS